jgi:hypothetical protein
MLSQVTVYEVSLQQRWIQPLQMSGVGEHLRADRAAGLGVSGQLDLYDHRSTGRLDGQQYSRCENTRLSRAVGELGGVGRSLAGWKTDPGVSQRCPILLSHSYRSRTRNATAISAVPLTSAKGTNRFHGK